MDKNKKKLILLGLIILALVVLIIADKAFKNRNSTESESTSESDMKPENEDVTNNQLIWSVGTGDNV